jgi:hypothetical protein
MTTETLEIPPLLTTVLEGSSSARRPSTLPRDLDESLRALAKRARAACVGPSLALKCRTEADAVRALDVLADGLAERRLEMARLFATHMARDPFLAFALLGETLALLKAEKTRITVRAQVGAGDDRAAWGVFRAALDAYGVTLHALADRFPVVLNGLVRGRPYDRAGQSFDWREAGLRINRGIARFEMGVLFVTASIKRRRTLGGPVFRASARSAWAGVDDAHVLMLEVLRRFPDEPAPAPPGRSSSSSSSASTASPDDLFDEWARAAIKA